MKFCFNGCFTFGEDGGVVFGTYQDGHVPKGYLALIKKIPAPINTTVAGTNERRSGTSRNRTGDTRIFSPMLYQLS